MDKTPLVSVIVATRNRKDMLNRLLLGLHSQLQPPSFEVIVADNSASHTAADILERPAQGFTLRGLHVPEPGKGRALNAALRQACGQLLVLTDDDVRPHPRWLTELHRAAQEHPEAAVFGGRIEVLNPVPRWIRESENLMGLLTTGHERSMEVYGYGQYPFGPNMAIRKRLILGIERPYPEDMGPGTALPVGDESAFLMPLSAPNARDRRYVHAASVVHDVLASRLKLSVALRRARAQGRSQARLGIPIVLPGEGPKQMSFAAQVQRRIRACRSLSEFACVVARQLGHVQECALHSSGTLIPHVPALGRELPSKGGVPRKPVVRS